MATVPIPAGRTVEQAGLATREQSVDLSPSAYGAQESSVAIVAGQALQSVADAELKLREDKAMLDMQAGVVALDVAYDQRYQELQRQDLGGRGLTEVVMEDYKQVAEDFVASQPRFTQLAARQSLLNSQARVAKMAVAEETRRFNQDVVNKSNDIINVMRNRIQFGDMDEATAQAQIDAFSKNLPANFREEITRNATENMRQASLSRLANQNPAAALKAIEEGKYNDVDASYVQREFRGAQAEVIRQQNEANQLRKEAQKLRTTDPVAAAQAQLASEGVLSPSYVQLQETQARLGIPAARRSAMTKATAEAKAYDLSTVENVDDFFIMRDKIIGEFGQAGVPENQAVKDLVELGDMSPALAVIVNADPKADDPQFVAAALQAVRDPEAPRKALENIKTRYPDHYNAALSDINSKVASHIEGDLSVMLRSGASVSDVNEYAETMRGIASIVYSEDVLRSNSLVKSKAKLQLVLSKGATSRTNIVNDNDAITLPAKTASALDEDVMGELRTGVLNKANVYVPPTYPSEELGMRDIKEKSGWAMAGNNTVTLRSTVTAQPVLFKNSKNQLAPLVLSYDDLQDVALAPSDQRVKVMLDKFAKDTEGAK